MAILRTFKTIENDIYVVVMANDTDALSNQDKDLMKKYGEPEIDLGGSFGTSPNVFTLPSKLVKIRSDFPIRQEFDSRSAPFDTNTLIKVNSWITQVSTEFSNAMTTLRDNTDTFTGESVTNI